jgi:phospholipid transport system transporter-binding protein
MSELVFEPVGEGHFRVRGSLSFDTADKALQTSLALFAEQQHIELDLQGVVSTDSAGLALLVEWVGWAHRERRKLVLHHVPAQAMALARISEVDKLLPAS